MNISQNFTFRKNANTMTSVALSIALGSGCKSADVVSTPSAGEIQRQECSVSDDELAISYFRLKASSVLNAKKFENKEAFLNSFSESFRRNFLLIYKTGSPDSASFTSPRILLFDDPDRPKFLMATDGSSDRKKFEIIEFSDKSRRFCFHEISIADNGALRFNDHPLGCVGCHTVDARPNWEAYNTWPNVYGSRDGAMKIDSTEGQGFKQFTERSRSIGVYSALAGPKDLLVNEGNGLARFFNDIEGRKISPHSQLTTGLVKNNNARIARILKELVDLDTYAPYKHALLGGLMGCPHIDRFLPDRLKQNHPLPYQQILQSTRIAILDGASTNDHRIGALNMPKNDLVAIGQFDTENSRYMTAIANLRYLLENRNQGSLNILGWSMSRTSSYHFAADGVGITDVGFIFQKDVFGTTEGPLNDQRYYDHSKLASKVSDTEFLNVCEQIKTASLKD